MPKAPCKTRTFNNAMYDLSWRLKQENRFLGENYAAAFSRNTPKWLSDRDHSQGHAHDVHDDGRGHHHRGGGYVCVELESAELWHGSKDN